MTKAAQVPLVTVELATGHDVVAARQRARRLAELLGFGAQDQSRIATAVSEICRNAFRYAGKGRCELFLDGNPVALSVRVTDQGPGIRNLDEVLAGRYQSSTGMGMGIVGTQRLVDRFEIETGPQGTRVELKKILPPGLPPPKPAALVTALARSAPPTPESEADQIERELLRAVGELRTRNDELEQIRQELEETNRGVVALYAELDQKAESLRKATELKSRFLSNMSHEFRTPLNSVQALARILLEGAEGPLNESQTKALQLVRKSALDLTEMVNDLLDLAKIEAGKVQVRPSEFDAGTLLGSLRGALRPLAMGNAEVQLVFEAAPEIQLHTDEQKLTQIVRNFASNALKFTERGEVRIGARLEPAGGEMPAQIVFFVKDTGIGIAAENHEKIFEEFSQIESKQQRGVKGTGLGLPLTRKLAELLGGTVWVESAPGAGSTFSVRVPAEWLAPNAGMGSGDAVLVAVDDPLLIASWEKFLEGSRYRLVAARSIDEAREWVRRDRPAAIIAAPFLGGLPTRPLLAEMKKDPETRAVPVLGFARAEHEERLLALGTDAIVHRLDERHELLEAVARAVGGGHG